MLERKGTKYTPNNAPLRAIYQCYFFGLGLTMMVLAIIAYGTFLDQLENYYYIIDNWKQDVLLDVQVVQGDDDCSKLSSRLGSDQETLVKYFWPGTKPGCDCRDGTRNGRLRILDGEGETNNDFYPQDIIYDDHACNSTQEDYGCKNIPSQGSRDFSYWTDGVTNASFKLCGKRLKGYNFIEKAPLTGHCDQGLKRCGSQANDDQFFCVPSDSLCPITQIGFEGYDSGFWKGSKILSSDEIVKIAIGQRLSLVYLRTYQEQLPVVEFRITESNEVCMKNKKTNISPGRSDYILMEQKRQSCSTDERFQAMHFIDEESFYRANNQLDLAKQLRGYEINKVYQWGMFSRGLILWRLHCRGQLMQDFINQGQLLESIASSQLGLLIISIIFFCLISIMLSVVVLANICGFDWPCIKGEGSAESNYIFTFEIVLKILLQTTQAILVLLAFSRVREEINFLNSLIDADCSDNVTLRVLGELRDVIKEKIYGYNTGQLVLFIITSLMDFAIIGVILLTKRSRQNTVIDLMKSEIAVNPIDGKTDQMDLQNNEPQITEQQYQPLPQQNPYIQQPVYDNNIPVQGGIQITQPQTGGIQAYQMARIQTGQTEQLQVGVFQNQGQYQINMPNPNQQYPQQQELYLQPNQSNPKQQSQYPNQYVSGPYG